MKKLLIQTKQQIQETRELYQTFEAALTSCNCLYCQNYITSIPTFPEWIHELAERTGIDLVKPAEIMQIDQQNERHQFLAIYHVVGESSLERYEEQGAIVFIETEELDFVPQLFPEPIVQLTVELWLPWVVDPLDEAEGIE